MEETLETKYVVHDCSALSLRKKPSVESEPIAYMPNGTEVKLLNGSKSKEWVKVSFNNLEGYCLRKFLLEKVADK